MENTLADAMMRKQGLEYSVEMHDGHIIQYLSRDTATAYYLFGEKSIIAPMQGPPSVRWVVEGVDFPAPRF